MPRSRAWRQASSIKRRTACSLAHVNTFEPSSVLSKPLLSASIAIYTLVGLFAFDTLGVAAVLPSLTADLGQVELLPWVITIYLLVSGVSTVVSGSLIDALGVRAIFRGGVSVFLIGSLAGGLAGSMEVLIAARVVQGIGGGTVFAVGLAAVSLIYPPHLIGRAYAANATVWGVMTVAGPAIAGLLLTVASWEWIFFVNLPLGLLALGVGWKVMPARTNEASKLSLDVWGTVMVLVFSLLVLFAVDGLGPISLVYGAASLVVAWLYLRRAKGMADPVIKRRHLIEPPFGLLGWTIGMIMIGGISAHSFFTLYVSGARQGSESLTAWALFFFSIGWTIGANYSSRLLDRMAETSVIRIGHITTVAGVLWVAFSAWFVAPLAVVFIGMMFAGSGLGFTTNSGITLLQTQAKDTETGRATAAHQFYRSLAFLVGSALSGAVILFVVGRKVGDLDAVRELLAGGAGSADATAAAIGRGFSAAAFLGATVSAAAYFPFRALRHHLAEARATADRT